MTRPQMSSGQALRALWLSVMTIACLVLATSAGLLMWLGGMHPALAIAAAGNVFGTWLTGMITIRLFFDG